MVFMPDRFRRSLAIFITILTAAALFGLTDSFAKIDENLANTGVTLGMIIAVLNIILLYLIYKHRVP